MINNGKINIYMNTNLNTNILQNKIISEFGLISFKSKIKWHIDNSKYYKCYSK